MWNNILKIARRKLWKSKSSSFTKLFSLSIGIISLFYIGLYVQREFSFDDFHTKRSSIFKANATIHSPTGNLELGLSAVPFGPYMKSVSPEIVEYTRIYKEYGNRTVKQGNALFSESENIYFADPSFFQLFDFKLISGNRETALEGPNNLLITQRTAQKYFGSTDVVGKVLRYDGTPMTVTGVLEDLPYNSHLQFDFLLTMDTFMQGRLDDVNDNWNWFPMNTYFLLQNPGDQAALEAHLQQIPQYQPENNPDDQYIPSLEPLDGLHFSDPKLGELGAKGSLSNLYLLLAIGIMILFLAISNYINLTTAALSAEARDVSMKRTLGASRKDIFKQFMAESFLVTLLSMFFSVAGIVISFPLFMNFMGMPLEFSVFSRPLTWLLILLLPFLLAAIGGVYPAFKFARIPALYKPQAAAGRHSILGTRTGLIVFQFFITSGLIIGSLLIYNQLNFLQDKELGIDIRQKLVLDYGPNSAIGNSYESLKEQFLQIPGVASATFSSHVPGQTPNGVSTIVTDANGNIRNGEISLTLVDDDFVSSYGLQLVAGRDFRPGVADSTTALILNEAAVKAFGYTNAEDIIGRSYEQWGGNGQVIGVVKDFNYLSLHNDIGLLSLKIWPQQFEKITLEVSEANMESTLNALESKWISLFPDIPFNYYFVDDNFLLQYTKDRQFATIMNLFALISVCIGVLGLVAYASFWCNRRKKEMSIKKVLGANSLGLLWNLYKGFSVPVFLGFALAIPVAVYLGNQWLSQFAYQFEMNWHLFFLPMMLLLGLVALAVGAQIIQLVHSNPVDNLKAEG